MKKTIVRRGFRGGRFLNRTQKRQVQAIINKNKKSKRTHVTVNQGLTASPVAFQFTTIAQGDDFDQRDTDKVRVTTIKAHLSFVAGSASGRVRLVIAVGKERALTGSDAPLFLSQVNRDLMWVIRDTYFTATTQTPVNFHMFHKFKTRRINGIFVYWDDAASLTTARKNAIYLFLVSDLADGPVASGFFETTFYDIA